LIPAPIKNPAKYSNIQYYICFFIQNEYYKQVCGEVCELIEDNEGSSKYRWIKKYPDVEALDCLVYILGAPHHSQYAQMA
jgi:phage terminase large subunit GpA-like protein